jgi:hypothetical protein
MMIVQCPKCSRVLSSEEMNVNTDVAVCRSCNSAFKLSEAILPEVSDKLSIENPPSGVTFEHLPNGFTITASTRSGSAIFLVPFALVWSGFSLAGLYGSQYSSGVFDLSKTLFGIPFLIGSIILLTTAAMKVFGEIIINVDNSEGSVFIGIDPIGWKRFFNWRDISSIHEGPGRFRPEYGPAYPVIFLEGNTRIAFGSQLTDERRYFVLKVLRKMRIAS